MEKLEEQLLIVLQKAIEVAEQTGEFAIEQAPLLLQEFYRWHIISNLFMVILFILLGILSFKNGNRVSKKQGDYVDTPIPFFSHFIAFISMIVVLVSIYNIIFILVAPKLYLIEYFIK